MRDGWLGDRDVQDLARQAVDLLYPSAEVTVEALNPADDAVMLRCPDTGGVVLRLSPDLEVS